MSEIRGPVVVGFVPPAGVANKMRARLDVLIPAHALSGAEVVALAHTHAARALIVDGAHKLDAKAMASLPPSVQVIATSSVGFDHLDIEAGHARGITLAHTPNVLTECTADLTMMLLLNACRRGRDYLDYARAGWPKRLGQADFLGQKLSGRTLGIVGMGRIGQAVAKRARAFGMRIAYYNRTRLSSNVEGDAQYCESLQKLLPLAEVLSLHAPGGASTRHLIDAKALACMPADSVLINVARGSLVDEDALYDSLVSGHLFAAGLDVFAHEPVGNPRLLGLSQVFATPHCGSATEATRDAMGVLCIEAVQARLMGQKPVHEIQTRS